MCALHLEGFLYSFSNTNDSLLVRMVPGDNMEVFKLELCGVWHQFLSLHPLNVYVFRGASL